MSALDPDAIRRNATFAAAPRSAPQRGPSLPVRRGLPSVAVLNAKPAHPGLAPSPFCGSSITRAEFPCSIAALESMTPGDQDLVELRVANFEHGGWLPPHSCSERAARRGVKPESVRTEWGRFVSRRLVAAHAGTHISPAVLLEIVRLGDYRHGFERYLASPYGIPFEVFVDRLRMAHHDPRIRRLIHDTLDRIECTSGETANKEYLRRDFFRGLH